MYRKHTKGSFHYSSKVAHKIIFIKKLTFVENVHTLTQRNNFTNKQIYESKMKPKSTRNEVGFNEFARNLKLNKKKNTRINLERNYKLNYENW